MRTGLFTFLTVLMTAALCAGQDSGGNCSQYNASDTPVPIQFSGTQNHKTGQHSFLDTLGGQCTYTNTGSGVAGSPCASACTALADVAGTQTKDGVDGGVLVGVDSHNLGGATNVGFAQAPAGGATQCGATYAVTVTACTLSCGANITFSGSPGGVGISVNFPSSTIMTASSPLVTNCAAQATPPACPGSPGFVCATGTGDGGSTSPTCSDGQWTCNGANECQLPPSQYTCGEGEYGTPSCGSSGWYCYQADSPIIIDTTGTGFHLTNFEDGVRFDITGDGRVQKISWIAAGSTNGWLALPHDGKVTTGKELFGNFTPQPPSDHPNGFLALAVYDLPEKGGNGDGVIDWHDAVWPKLRIWIDKNHDGVAQPDELFTLPSLGVNSLALTYVESKYTDKFGNQFRYKGSANPDGAPSTDHVDKTMYDVFLLSSATKAKTKPQVAKTDLAADHQLR